MFDRLIESGRQPRRRRAGGYLLGASVLYVAALVVSASLAIMWFNPGLAEALEMTARLTPPRSFTRPSKALIQTRSGPSQAIETGFASPVRIADRSEAVREDLPIVNSGPSRPVYAIVGGGQQNVPGGGWAGGVELSGRDSVAPPRPREPTPAPTPPRIAEPRPVVSEGVLRGRAITTFTPPYPDMARKAGISGQVQIQVLISEDGRVVEATVLNGNPFLQGQALAAAQRWIFSPTKLNGIPVKVQGILTFNFTLR